MTESFYDSKIRVALRMRPSLPHERYVGNCLMKTDEVTLQVSHAHPTAVNGSRGEYTFDCVLDETDTQQDVYGTLAADFVDAALQGYSATILAYGQTGTGKTYTIFGAESSEGSDGGIHKDTGLFLRAVHDMAGALQGNMNCKLTALEVYNDDVYDLLNERRKVTIRDSGDSTIVEGVTNASAQSVEDILRTYRSAEKYRRTTSTKMNAASSRSHAYLRLDFVGRGSLCLVDLAGSERVKKSEASDAALVEAQQINLSLSSLGNVIHALVHKAKHVPFRDSKLTRLLRGVFLSPEAKMAVIATVSPSIEQYAETLCTLQFANRLKDIQTANREGGSSQRSLDAYEEEQGFRDVLRTMDELSAEIRISRCFRQHQSLPQEGMSLLSEDEIKAIQSHEMNSLRQTLSDHFESIKRHSEEVTQVEHENEKLQNELDSMQANVTQEEEKLTKDAKKAKKSRKTSEEAVELLQEAIKTKTTQSAELQSKMDEITTLIESEKNALASERGINPFDEPDNPDEGLCNLVKGLTSYREAQQQYFLFRTAVEKQNRVNDIIPCTFDELTYLRAFSLFLVHRSVDVAEGTVDSKDSFAVCDVEVYRGDRLKSWHEVHHALDLSLRKTYPPTVGDQSLSWDTQSSESEVSE
eukprot:PhF_6_TR17104/c0_g1_i2/m.26330